MKQAAIMLAGCAQSSGGIPCCGGDEDRQATPQDAMLVTCLGLTRESGEIETQWWKSHANFPMAVWTSDLVIKRRLSDDFSGGRKHFMSPASGNSYRGAYASTNQY